MKNVIYLLTFLFLFSESALASKKEALKQIETLNHQIQQAGEKGDLQAAITAAEEVLAISQKTFGEQAPEAAKALNNVANLYLYSDNALQAERLYKEAILIEADKYGKDSKELADSYYNLAMAYAVQKKYEEGRQMLTKSHQIRLKNFGEDHPDTKKAREALDQIWSETMVSLPE